MEPDGAKLKNAECEQQGGENSLRNPLLRHDIEEKEGYYWVEDPIIKEAIRRIKSRLK